MINVARQLTGLGVLGINRRNIDYIRKWNPRRLYPLVDDKLRTKQLAIDSGMPVPALFAVISTQHDIRELPALLGDRDQFVVKPAHGSGGNGVLVIKGRRRNLFFKSSGAPIEIGELNHHLSNMLSGLYSLGGQRDRVMVEYCVQTASELTSISYRGVPDIRLIVFRGYPVMAMIRLPTRLSDGRANLHQGAVGVGIDIGTGTTLGGVLENRIVSEHPDTGLKLADMVIPHWDRILEMAALGYEMTGLGYLGLDVVVDRDLGPMILEANARPGLNIQIANESGLQERLDLVQSISVPDSKVEERLAFSRQHFSINGSN